MKGVIVKVESLNRDQSDTVLQKTFFTVAPFMVQIYPKYFHSHNIQLVQNSWKASFHQPVKISIDSLAAVASLQFVSKYIKYKSNVKETSKYFSNAVIEKG